MAKVVCAKQDPRMWYVIEGYDLTTGIDFEDLCAGSGWGEAAFCFAKDEPITDPDGNALVRGSELELAVIAAVGKYNQCPQA